MSIRKIRQNTFINLKNNEKLVLHNSANKVKNLRRKFDFLTQNHTNERHLSAMPIVRLIEGADTYEVVCNDDALEFSEHRYARVLHYDDVYSDYGNFDSQVTLLAWESTLQEIKNHHKARTQAAEVFHELKKAELATCILDYHFSARKLTQAAFCRFLDICHKNFNKKWLRYQQNPTPSLLKLDL